MGKVILYHSRQQVLAARKRIAASAESSLGVTVSTPQDFCSDLWDVWGDGRSLVTGVHRLAFAFEAVRKQGSLAQSLGMAQLVGRFADCYALDLLGDDGRLNADRIKSEHLHDAEISFLQAVESYFDSLEQHGLIEWSQACRLLSRLGLEFHVEIPQTMTLHPAIELLIDPWIRGDARVGGEGHESILPPLPNGVDPAFLFPAGPTATLPLVRAELLSFFDLDDARALREGLSGVSRDNEGGARPALTAVVLASDANDAYDALAPVLVDAGVSCQLDGRLRFSDSAFGRAFQAARFLCEEGGSRSCWQMAATDFAYSPWSGMSEFEARQLDTVIRRDRLFSREQACAHLREASASFGLFQDAFGQDAAGLKRFLSGSSKLSSVVPSSVWAREQGMLDALLDLADAVEGLGFSGSDVAEIAGALEVPVSGETRFGAGEACGGRAPSVTVSPLDFVDSLPLQGYDLVVVTDVTEDAFPARPQDVSLAAVLAKLNLTVQGCVLDRQRQRFACAMRAARKRFVCVMPLHDENKEDTYPAFLLDEYIAGLTLPGDEPSKDFLGVPQRLLDKVSVLGEDNVADCLGQARVPANEMTAYPRVQRGMLHSGLLHALKTAEEGGRQLPVLSPSALERYIECPYGWFVERFIRLNQVDEEFGPLEQGNFVHEVFEAFYNALASKGVSRVSPDELCEAEAVLDQVFDESLAAQEKGSQTRLIPVTQAEFLAVDQLRLLLHDSIRWQAELAPGYRVDSCEDAIGVHDCVDYAGARLIGRVDRIDVDPERRRFAIVDYKSSTTGCVAGFDEDADAEDGQLPAKIQTLAYAQALRGRFEGYACAGALYLGYRAKVARDVLAGSYDPSVYDPAGLSGASSRVCMDFGRFLDLVEDKVRPYVESLVGGDIAPRPTGKKACSHCPFPWCEGRL